MLIEHLIFIYTIWYIEFDYLTLTFWAPPFIGDINESLTFENALNLTHESLW